MKLIFLDIDGVLNYAGCTARSPSGCIGIDICKLKLLKELVDKTGGLIVLTSTWKMDWSTNAKELPPDGEYLDRIFHDNGLTISDKTSERDWSNRGMGILDFISWFPYTVDSFVILDDEEFDFNNLNLTDKHIHTSFVNGLLPADVERAVHILNDC